MGDTGFEPVTSSVSGKRATAAPIALDRRFPRETVKRGGCAPRWRRDSNPRRRLCRPLPNHSATPPGPGPCGQGRRSRHRSCRSLRADDGSRTRDIHHGKVVLYQLSYVRMSCFGRSLDLPIRNSSTTVPAVFAPVRGVQGSTGSVSGAASQPLSSPEPVGVPDRWRLYGTLFRNAKSPGEPRRGGCRRTVPAPELARGRDVGYGFRAVSAIGAVVARFVHTEEVTGSNPVSRTSSAQRAPAGIPAGALCRRRCALTTRGPVPPGAAAPGGGAGAQTAETSPRMPSRASAVRRETARKYFFW